MPISNSSEAAVITVESSLSWLAEAVTNEDYDAAATLATRVCELTPSFAAAARNAEESDHRWRLVLEALEAARRSALTARQHLRSQARTLKQSSAYSQSTLEREPRWTTAL